MAVQYFLQVAGESQCQIGAGRRSVVGAGRAGLRGRRFVAEAVLRNGDRIDVAVRVT
jgi:hypothetical protein